MAKYTSTAGNDTFTGALGNDIVVFNDSIGSYIFDVTGNVLNVADTLPGAASDGLFDQISGIEKLIFTGDNKQMLVSQEAIVNITTKGQQTETAMLATNDGGFYSFWQSSANVEVPEGEEVEDDGEGYYFRKFNANGSGTGVDVRLLTGIGGGVKQAIFDDNSFVLVWTGSDSSGSGVFVQKFDSTGKALFEKFRVNDTITANQATPDVAVLENGGFVVVWASENQGDSLQDGVAMGDTPNQTGVFSQLFDANANPVGWETKVSPSGGGAPAVAATNDGGYVVTYEALVSGDDVMKIFAHKYDANGEEFITGYYVDGKPFSYLLDNNPNTPAEMIYINKTTEFTTGNEANELKSDSKKPNVVTLADGKMVFVWQAPVDAYPKDSGAIDYDRSVMFRIYDTDLTTSMDDRKANTNDIHFNNVSGLYEDAVYEQSEPSVAALTDGGFIIVWQSMQSDNSYWGIYAQRFDSIGNKVGSQFLVNTKTADSQKIPSVVGLSDGGFVISWEAEHQDGVQQGLFQEGSSGTEIVMQRYDASGNKLGHSFAGTAAADNLVLSGTDSIELDGAAGNDTLSTSAGNDTIRGGLGDDSMSSNDGNDIIIGGAGKDTISAGKGNDTINGGADADRLVLTGNYADYTILGGNGTYTITDLVADRDGIDLISGIEVISFADQEISVDSGSSGGTTGELVAGDVAVADTLNGGDNNDTLQGGGNNKGVALDTLQGGDGDDTYIITGNAAVIFDTAGTDTLQIAAAIDLTKQFIGKLDGLEYIENVVLLGTKALKLIGDENDNELTGNNSANNIKGGAGDDVLNGGLGKDVLTGGEGDDIFIFNATPSKANVDKIVDFGNGSDSIHLADAFFADLDPDGDGTITYIEGKGLKAASNDEVSFIVYDTRGGGLYYDAAGESAVLIATFGKVSGAIPDLDASDFSLI